MHLNKYDKKRTVLKVEMKISTFTNKSKSHSKKLYAKLHKQLDDNLIQNSNERNFTNWDVDF